MPGHSEVHAAEIGHQPDKPDNNAITVETHAQGFAAIFRDPARPERVREHEPDGDLTREGVRFKKIERTFGDEMHGISAGEVEEEANPECNDVPGL